jgi:hypothetical protein
MFRFLTAIALLLLGALSPTLAQPTIPSFAPAMLDVQQLPRFRPFKKVGAFSSYDRTGGNDDGFSGKYSFLRKEGDGLVLADVAGPGAITRIWTAAPVSDSPIEFYFDGEATPRLVLPLRDLFSGKLPPFVSPLSGHGLGGYYSYVPLEFAKSIKVVVRAKEFHFYMINYALYEPDVPVRTFTSEDSFRLPEIKYDGNTEARQWKSIPGSTLTLFDAPQAGRIQSFRLRPASGFAGKERAFLLRIYWDGEQRPAVNVPVGDFFGYSFGQPATRSLLVGTEGDWNYVRFPMPFAKSARIELVDQRTTGEPLNIETEVIFSSQGKRSDEGNFHAEWKRENPTVNGRPFTYLDVSGRGHLVATMLQSQGMQPGQTDFFEGDDIATIDGEIAIHGTGSEDSFNGGWYAIPGRWDDRGSLPFSGCLDYYRPLARTGGYRLFLNDAYTFRHRLRYDIEHGGEGNNVTTDYVGTSFYYLDRPGGSSKEPPVVSERAVRDPDSFMLTFISLPPMASMLNASVELASISMGKTGLDILSFSGNRKIHGVDFDSSEGPPLATFYVDVPRAGRYAISAEGIADPSGAMLQLRDNDEPIGNVVDFYSPTSTRSGPKKLGELYLQEGKNPLSLALPRRNRNSTGTGVNLINLRGDWLPPVSTLSGNQVRPGGIFVVSEEMARGPKAYRSHP